MEPSEFNVTKYLKSGENQISLEVYRYSDGSYLEDQDFWRFGGIHRSIHLIHTPDIHVRDYAVRTLPHLLVIIKTLFCRLIRNSVYIEG